MKINFESVYHKTKLENGITLISCEKPYLHSFSLGIYIRVGSRDENINNNGIVHFIEHAVFKGTHKRTAKQISAIMESKGGYLNAFTTKEYTCFYVKALSDYLEIAVELLSDILFNSKFDTQELEKEKSVIIDEINSYLDNPEENILDVLDEEVFRGTTLAFPIVGKVTNIKKLKRSEILSFLSKYYNYENMVISCVGNVKHDILSNIILKYFNKKTRNSLNDRELINLKHYKRTLIKTKDINQVYICLGRKSVGLKNSARSILNAINTILGDGASSRLFVNIREKNGLAYNLFSFVNFYRDVSSFGIFASTTKENHIKLFDLLQKEMLKIHDKGINKKELKDYKTHFAGNLYLSLENPVTLMSFLAKSEINFGRIRTEFQLIDEINKINLDELNEFGKELFITDKYSLIKYLPIN